MVCGAFEPGALDNTYNLFEAGGHEWIAVALEWGPRDEVIAWADRVMAQHPDRLGILVTHAYLNNNNRRYDHTDIEHPQDFNPHECRRGWSDRSGSDRPTRLCYVCRANPRGAQMASPDPRAWTGSWSG